MGAGSTKACLISFKTSNVNDVGRFNKTIINLDVLSVGYDRSLGGQEFDIRLQKYFAEEFDKKFSGKLKSSIFTSERAMTRLYKEANRIKQILSANTDAIASVNILQSLNNCLINTSTCVVSDSYINIPAREFTRRA